jgi:hypothetical protein
MDPDPNLGGPKTCGSGGSGFGSVSAKLQRTVPYSGFTVKINNEQIL